MHIDPGSLNRLVQVQQRSRPSGDFGHPVDDWEAVTDAPASVWASIKPVGGSQRLAAMAQQMDLSHTLVMRYHPALALPVRSGQWRIVYGTRIFAVEASRELGDGREWIMFDCQEGGADGH